MRVITPDSPEYPDRLRAQRRPPTLWLRGALPARRGVAVVGTRRPTPEAEQFGFQIGTVLASEGFAVWSGGAAGIDWAAHEGAISGGGPTVIVPGSGLEVPYPRGAQELWRRAAESGGVLAIVPPDAPPRPPTFFRRNGVLAALCDAVVLVECPLASGARNTTAQARKLGRPVHVVTHAPWALGGPAAEVEIRLGGRPLLSIEGLLDALAGTPDVAVPSSPPAPPQPLSDDPLVRALQAGPAHPDELAARTSLAMGDLWARLVGLQIEGLAEVDGDGKWRAMV